MNKKGQKMKISKASKKEKKGRKKVGKKKEERAQRGYHPVTTTRDGPKKMIFH